MARTAGWLLPHLAAWREARFLTPKELADSAGIALSTLSHLEHQRRRAGPRTLNRLTAALGITREQLLNEAPNPKAEAVAA